MLISFGNLKYAVSAEIQKMLRDGRKGGSRVVKSRGKQIWWCGPDGNGCDEKPFWDGTKRQLMAYSLEAIANGAILIGIDLGADGADSVWDFNQGNYDPYVAEGSVDIWNKQDGWLF